MSTGMTGRMVLWYLDLFERMASAVWIDGGWGIDALLGTQTRPHDDLDIMIPTEDSTPLVTALRQHGFHRVQTEDECERNFVLDYSHRGCIDFHVMELTEVGNAVYNPRGEEWHISAMELAAEGRIEGRAVRCLSPEYQVRAHTGYELQDSDFIDMMALRDRFGVVLLPEQIKQH